MICWALFLLLREPAARPCLPSNEMMLSGLFFFFSSVSFQAIPCREKAPRAQCRQFTGVAQRYASAVRSASVIAAWLTKEQVCFLAIVHIVESELRKGLVDPRRVLFLEGPQSRWFDFFALTSPTRQSLRNMAGHEAGADALVSRAQLCRRRAAKVVARQAPARGACVSTCMGHELSNLKFCIKSSVPVSQNSVSVR